MRVESKFADWPSNKERLARSDAIIVAMKGISGYDPSGIDCPG